MDSDSRNPFTLKAGIAEERSCKGTLLTNHCQLRRSPRPRLAPLSGGTTELLPWPCHQFFHVLALCRKGKGGYDPRGSDSLIALTLMKGLYRDMSMEQSA